MWAFYLVELRQPSPESQPISNQPICNIEVPAFQGLGNAHNKCLKKTVSRSRLNNLPPTNEQFSKEVPWNFEELKRDAHEL
jgi:hypothetical protein